MAEISIYRVSTSMVRGFFEGFFSGLIDGLASDNEQKKDPRFVKQTVANHYDEVAANFVNVAFPLLIALNFDSYEQAVSDMKARRFSNTTPAKILLRYSCRSKELFDAIIDEYKEQMSSLLLGHIQRPGEHIDRRNANNTAKGDNKAIATDQAIRTVVRAMMHGYTLGIKRSRPENMAHHQPTVLRMMVNGMTTLLHDAPLDVWKDAEKTGLDGIYRRVTINEHNYETLINEMNQAYQDLAAAEGAAASDDSKKTN